MDNETKTYSVDMSIRIFIDAKSKREAEDLATNQFFDTHPCGEFYNLQVREGVWHVFYVGDETDSCVWQPTPLRLSQDLD